jgi:hypothetical protein
VGYDAFAAGGWLPLGMEKDENSTAKIAKSLKDIIPPCNSWQAFQMIG